MMVAMSVEVRAAGKVVYLAGLRAPKWAVKLAELMDEMMVV